MKALKTAGGVLAVSVALFGAAACATGPVEGVIVEILHDPSHCEKMRKGVCAKVDDEDCDLRIQPARKPGETEEQHAKVDSVVVEVPCNDRYFSYKVGNHWYR